jgi:hypothetical protein
MPKASRKRHSSSQRSSKSTGKVTGPVLGWPPEKRLEYHIAECAMHLQMIEQITDEAATIPNPHKIFVLKHRKEAGQHIKLIHMALRKKFPAILPNAIQ